MKNEKIKLLYLLIPVAFAVLAFTAIFIFSTFRIKSLSDRLAKAIAHSVMVENELIELEKEYDTLKDRYAMLEQTKSEQNNSPVVYLTFDDGPSLNTVKILDILDKYNIKATFFIIGNESDYARDIYRRMVEGGHTIGNHTYSHDYKQIYSSADTFWEDFEKADELLYELTGKHTDIMRFPGGSNNTVSERYSPGIMKTLVEQAKELEIPYFDWNVSSRDAEKVVQDKNVIVKSVLDGCKDKDRCIVLMHDNSTKISTVEALPEIIEELKKRGYVFKALAPDTEPIQFNK